MRNLHNLCIIDSTQSHLWTIQRHFSFHLGSQHLRHPLQDPRMSRLGLALGEMLVRALHLIRSSDY